MQLQVEERVVEMPHGDREVIVENVDIPEGVSNNLSLVACDQRYGLLIFLYAWANTAGIVLCFLLEYFLASQCILVACSL